MNIHSLVCALLGAIAFTAGMPEVRAQISGDDCRCQSESQEVPVDQCKLPNSVSIASRGQSAGQTGGSNFMVAYDQDDRIDYYDDRAASYRPALDAAVAIVFKVRIEQVEGGKHKFVGAKSLMSAPPPPAICCGELFCRQSVVAHCSGVLVGRRRPIVLTASHCFKDGITLDKVNFVIGYKIAAKGIDLWGPLELTVCTGLADTVVQRGKWLLVALDCPPGAALPKVTARGGQDDLTANQKIFAAGFPQGLPVKLASNATINGLETAQDGTVVAFFAALDLFEGSSGSGVYKQRLSDGKPALLGIVEKGLADHRRVKRGPFECRRTCVIDTKTFGTAGETITALTPELIAAIDQLDEP